MLNPVQKTIDCIKEVKALSKNNECILFYSGGKDSICTLDFLVKYFDKVYCVFMYIVKDMEHQTKFLKISKSLYGDKVEIIQVPDWTLSYMIRNGHYCNPRPDMKVLELSDIVEHVRHKINKEAYVAFGMKQTDSQRRKLLLGSLHNGCINHKTKKFYPIAFWKNLEVVAFNKMKALPLPVQYGTKYKASVGFSFSKRVLSFLAEEYPEDYAKVLKAFPEAIVVLNKI